MSSSTKSLYDFIKTVPVCKQQASLEKLLKLFQSVQPEIVAVVNSQQFPVGVIASRSLIAHLLQHSLVNPISGINVDPAAFSPALMDWRSLMQPLTILSAQMNLDEVLSHLQASDSSCEHETTYGIVDTEGKFLGLLANESLLKSCLAARPQIPEFLPSKDKENLSLSSPLFLAFLEQFPLPLMLQTTLGELLLQNRSWREQIGAFIPPDDATACPLTLAEMKPLTDNPGEALALQPECFQENYDLALQLAYHQLQGQILLPQEIASRHQVLNSPAKSAEVNTPSPLEPSQNFGEGVWQFVKCPLDLPSFSVPICLVVATDVSEQQRLCKELTAKNADLLQLNRLKDEFLACISHELKSPLTAVVGLSSLLKEQKVGKLNAKQAHYAELIYNSGRQLMTLVNDLLDLTRLETGQMKLNLVSIPIKSLCEQAYRAIEAKYRGKANEPLPFTLTIESGLEKLVADELRLQQMLVHLLDNAIKFTGSGGEIGLEVSRWDQWIALTVWDTGIGIPEDCQHLIFQKFQQLESPLTRSFEGTGLGLVLTQRLARAHGGDVSFVSTVGKGSQFTLLLPPHLPLADGALEPDNESQGCNPFVLIVEAIPTAIADLTTKLTDLDYHVVIARTGTEALEKARELRPHAIFLNPALPLLSGWDVLTLLKADARTQDIRVILTATQEDSPPKLKGADGFLELPVESQALQAALMPRASKRLTILRLHPELATVDPKVLEINDADDLALAMELAQFNHRIVEADDLEQADTIARVWHIDVVVLDGKVLQDPLAYLRSLGQCETLSTLPLVTLDAKTTKAANRINGLSVFPCLIPDQEQSFKTLLQVIQIAAG